MGSPRVLVVEDEALIAMDLVECLEELGLQVVGPLDRLDLALAAAKSESIDLALLDIDLNGRSAYPVADELRARRIPFAFVTGTDQENLQPPYEAHLSVSKPYSSHGIEQVVTSLLQRINVETAVSAKVD